MNPQTCCLLSDVPAGRVVRVQSLKEDCPARARLYALGILPGTELEVGMECCGRGMRRIRVRNSSVILDEQMTDGIECVTLTENEMQHRLLQPGHCCCGRRPALP